MKKYIDHDLKRKTFMHSELLKSQTVKLYDRLAINLNVYNEGELGL